MVPDITVAMWRIGFSGSRVESFWKGRVTCVIGILRTFGFPFYISLLFLCVFFSWIMKKPVRRSQRHFLTCQVSPELKMLGIFDLYVISNSINSHLTLTEVCVCIRHRRYKNEQTITCIWMLIAASFIFRMNYYNMVKR